MITNQPFVQNLDTRIFLDMFPFYMLLDCECNIASIGPSLLKACPDLRVGLSAQNYFECKSPAKGLTIEAVSSPSNNLYIIRHIKTKTIYRGSKVFLDERKLPFLILKPWISQPEDLKRLNLILSDFPAHDQTLDIIQLLQTHRIAVSDLNMLNDALQVEKNILKEQRDELDWIYKNAPIGLAVFDSDGRFIHINEYLAKIDQLTVESHIGKNIHDILPLVAGRFDRAKEAITLTKCPFLDQENEICFPSEPTQIRYFNENWYPIFDKGREISGFGVLVEETTAKRSADKLREADNKKNQFLAALSHELRNPVATIGMSIEIIKDKIESNLLNISDLNPYIDRADRQLKHLKYLLDDLLEVSRITQGKIELKAIKLDIKDILREALDLSLQKIESLKHELIINWPNAGIYIHGDHERLIQIFSNLIDNAAKYTDKNGKIEISIITVSDFVEITIKDNGVGINSENISNIFEMFYQIKSSQEKRGLGLGIGLALVHQLVKLHSGSIAVTSDGEGKGSTFVVKFPLYKQHG